MDPSKVKHDFINNGLRIEILNKLISEALEQKTEIQENYLNDLSQFLKKHIELLKEIEKI